MSTGGKALQWAKAYVAYIAWNGGKRKDQLIHLLSHTSDLYALCTSFRL